MLYIKQAKGTMDEVAQKLTTAAASHNFGILGVHNLKEKIIAKGLTFGPECQVFEVCNPAHAKSVLEANLAIANALPCRICVYEEDGKVKVSTLKPTAMLALFQAEGVESVAREVEAAMTSIIDEACS
jgi:uncharacterized protein (DUF302 family)